MNNKLKCPFCQQELKTWAKYTDGTSKMWCSKCNLFGDSGLFEELIRTRKALDVAVDALKEITNNDYDADWQNDLAQATLEKIKDIK